MPTTTNMGLTQPIVGGDSSIWGSTLNNNNDLLDTHDHSSGKGVAVTPAGLSINSDLSYRVANVSSSAIDLKKAAFYSEIAVLSTGHTNCVYVKDGELHYNNNVGTSTQMTNGGSLYGPGVISGMGGTTTSVNYSNASQTYTFLQNTGFPAKLVTGDLKIYETLSGITNFITLKSPAALGASATITLPSVTGTLATLANTETLTNKTISASANTISNLSTTNLAAGTLITATNLSGALDTNIPSTLAVKTYVDNISAGVVWKASVRVVAETAVTLVSDCENGDTINGVVLATGDRIALIAQSSGAENGIYEVAASGAPTRSADADTSVECFGMAFFAREGTTSADKAWICTNDSINLGTTALTFSQFFAGTLTAGTGVTVTGGTISTNASQTHVTALGTVNTGTWNATAVTVPYGGTGATSATAYAVLCGGTTSTGAYQSVASLGTAGQALTSNGPGALPTFQSLQATSAVDNVFTINDNSDATKKIAFQASSITTGNTRTITMCDVDITLAKMGGSAPTVNTYAGGSIWGGNNATAVPAGAIGEVLSSYHSGGVNAGGDVTWTAITSLAITAGVWLVHARYVISVNGATLGTGNNGLCVGTTSASSAGATVGKSSITAVHPSSSKGANIVLLPFLVNISGTTTYYLNGYTSYSAGTPQFDEWCLVAVRIA